MFWIQFYVVSLIMACCEIPSAVSSPFSSLKGKNYDVNNALR